MPQTIACAVDSELLIKKSRFLGRVQPVADRKGAQAIVAELRAQHPGAAHVCWALLAGGESAAVDDGEPSGTAGRPMLEVLRHQDLEGVLATVVRYYGGVRLGAGGLVRAYTDCVAQALKSARRSPIVRLQHFACELPYDLEGLFRREIEAAGGVLAAVQHAAQVQLRFAIADTQAAALLGKLNDAARGRVNWVTAEC